MVGVISWLKGYVRIRVSGLSVERFLNLCGHKNILLWNVVRGERYWEMCISISAFRRIRPIVRKTGTRVVITERCGLPFFVKKMNGKKVFLFGLIFTIFFWYASGNFVWRIEFEGNYKITQEQLMDFLDENWKRIYVFGFRILSGLPESLKGLRFIWQSRRMMEYNLKCNMLRMAGMIWWRMWMVKYTQ